MVLSFNFQRSTEHERLVFIKRDYNKSTYNSIYLRLNNSIKQLNHSQKRVFTKTQEILHYTLKLCITSVKYTYFYISFFI